MKALVTGVCGFTGRYLARELADSGYEVFGLAQAPIPVKDVAHIYSGDLLDADRIRQVIGEVQPDVVVHLAAISFVAHDRLEELYRTNVLGTRCLLDAIASQARQCGSVLVTSSANIYGNSTAVVLSEDVQPAPANDYAISKLAMEHVTRLYSERLPLVIVRPFNYTGVGQAEHFLIPKIVSHVQRRASSMELGNLDVARDFSDVRRVVRYYRKLLESTAAVGQTLNVCSGYAYTLEEILEMVSHIAGYQIDVRVNPAFVRSNEVKHLVGSSARLDNLVGEVPGIPFADTLRWMMDTESGAQL
jgi:nucleoside-diphosphate-sugar epimerase